jgi:hypothetical protein
MVRFSAEVRSFVLPQTSKLAPCLTQPPTQWVPDSLSHGCKDNCLLLSNVEVTNEWSYMIVPTYDVTV